MIKIIDIPFQNNSHSGPFFGVKRELFWRIKKSSFTKHRDYQFNLSKNVFTILASKKFPKSENP